MALSPGDKLGPYEIAALIGKGGMGEVWKARDTRLDRIVAIKVSQEHFSERFEREAKVIAALNHSNVCTLYDVGPNYLVMEFIEGTPLKGPLPVDQALKYAAQICDALDAAHKKGITHRDLKPANILVTKAGIKLLDFGLAKLGSSGIGQAANPPGDATLTMALTGNNEIVGTLFYMSPEQLQAQATGKEVDARSDIFSFGLVLYELLTGKRAFEGSSPASVIAGIMERPAPSIADGAPRLLDRVLRKCLAKDPDERWQSVRDLKDELEWIAGASAEATAGAGPDAGRPAPSRSRLKDAGPWIAVGFMALLLAALAFVHFREVPARPAEVRFQIPASEKTAFNIYLALSPDGRNLAYVADGADGQSRLWIRSMDSLESRSLAGTEGAVSPFWSPDGRSIAFAVGNNVKRIDVLGGPVQTVCEVQGAAGVGVWGPSGIMMVGNRGNGPGLWRVSAVGGTVSLVTKVDTSRQERAHGFPVLLPDGKHFLYTRLSGVPANGGIFLGSVESQPDAQGGRRILPAQSSSAYVPPAGTGPGYLLYLQDRILMAQPFDAWKFELTGEPVPLAEQIGTLGSYGFFSASASGTLAYRLGGVDANNRQLTWYDRQGKALSIVGPPVVVQSQPVISPDGSAVAIARADRQAGFNDIWVHEVSRNTDSRLTYGPLNSTTPVWSPDGRKIAFSNNRDGAFNLYQKNSSGVGPDETLDKDQRIKTAKDWSHDGRYIIEEVNRSAKTGLAVWVLPLFGDRKPFPYLEAQFDQDLPKLSPNGQWLAYQSNETKRNEIYVQTFPTPGGKWQVSTDGGTSPVWSRDGKEIFFIGENGKMMSVEVKNGVGNKFDSGLAKPLFDFPNGAFSFDVSKDGRFLIPAPAEQAASAPITVVVNWAAGLKRN
jgi:Tol biopolymer transport system component/predicted Ser/Thr protein kinase